MWLDRLRIDDPVGAISAHGICGAWGLLAVVLSNPEASVVSQLIGLLSIAAFVMTASLIVWALLRATVGIRVSDEEEATGVDVSECGIEAYPEFTSANR